MKNTAICINLKLLRLRFNTVLLFGVIISLNAFGSVENTRLSVRVSRSEVSRTKQPLFISVLDSARTDKKVIARFIVSFNSICCGIDHKKNEEFLNFLGKYKNSPAYTTYNWGEEGEMDYCFFLKEMTEKEQDAFIKKARKLLGNSRLIGTYENISCPR